MQTIVKLQLSLVLAIGFVFGAPPKPAFTPLFPHDGPVTKGRVVRTWSNMKDSAEYQRSGKSGTASSMAADRRPLSGLAPDCSVNLNTAISFSKISNSPTAAHGQRRCRFGSSVDPLPSYYGMELQIRIPLRILSSPLPPISSPARSTRYRGEWNCYRIDLRGPKLKVWLNDFRTPISTPTRKRSSPTRIERAGAATLKAPAPRPHRLSGTQRTR
jgi:hypothetical protein